MTAALVAVIVTVARFVCAGDDESRVTVVPTPTVSPAEVEFAECFAMAEILGYDVTAVIIGMAAASKDGTVTQSDWAFLLDLCKKAIEP